MLTVRVYRNDTEIARMRIERVHMHTPEAVAEADYIAQVAVERAGLQQAVGLHTVHVTNFPRLRRNVWALIKTVLDGMTEEDLNLEPDTVSADLAGRLYRPLPEVQGGTSRLRDYRSAFRRGQSEQYGYHDRGTENGPQDR